MATAEQDQPPKDATKGPNELFKYSAWAHAGQGAEDCEEAETGMCGNPLHFHAWCRLPNQLQHEDIRERALAAKARRIRQLRDPECDAYQILESDMSELLRIGDEGLIVDELANKGWWKRQIDAMAEIEDSEEFKTVDRERLGELRVMDPDVRPRDETDELERHVKAYTKAIEARVRELEAPIRESLEALSREQLIDQVREERVSAEANNAFMESYSRWEWLAGSYTSAHPVDRQRRFRDVDQLVEAAPEVLDVLQRTFSELESSLQRGAAGN
jgi:hypothetical protein